MTSGRLRASEWAAIADATGPSRKLFKKVYGTDPDVTAERAGLLRAVAETHLRRFGDGPLRVFRCPGRINLRGMHVDTHGGYLNLMTHQREIVLVLREAEDGDVVVANTEPVFDETRFALEVLDTAGIDGDWPDFIMQPRVRAGVEARRGHWSHYVRGAFLSVLHRFPGARPRGFDGVIGSDMPRGAALSSSAALCICLVKAILALNRLKLSGAELAETARDAEWYTGSRCGLSDQAAMVLGGVGEMVNLALDPARPDFSGARRLRFPDALAILVINSYTERSLSGPAGVDYTRNRFAYGMALEILRQEMARQGLPESLVEKARRLSTLSPVEFEEFGGTRYILDLLRRIPEEITVADLRARYDLPGLDALYDRYFASAPAQMRPTSVALRGPLLFGIAESERARVFADALEVGNYARAGRLMTIGHDGDRRTWHDRRPPDVSDAALEQCIAQGTPLETMPGAYGAGSGVLDALVDVALEAGALGASLTGAGMAGTVLALCRREDAGRVAQAVRAFMSGAAYLELARRNAPLTREELNHAAVLNHATAAPGEFGLGQ
ncbi:MAG TPA: galactokinase family protein [Candidatus Bathyarchaeia archaeon]|nr:galactokinase family protein [Candidatus Bathyarchaeia archaeon]